MQSNTFKASGGTSPSFTPGPWEPEYDEADGAFRIRMASSIGAPRGWRTIHLLEYVDGIWEDDASKDHAEASANTNLIAAAPELYETCRRAHAMLKDGPQTHLVKALAAALAKASGDQS